MNLAEFNQQMSRLVNHFGKHAMSEDKAVLVYREVNSFSAQWLNFVVDDFIGNFRQPPLVSDFSLRASEERERQHQSQRAKEKQDAKDFWQGTYQPDDKKVLCQQIIARMEGRVSDSDWAKFIEMLEYAANGPSQGRSPVCRECEGTGLIQKVINQYETPGVYSYRCKCSAGNKYPKFQEYHG